MRSAKSLGAPDDVTLAIEAVPLLEGARETVAAGIFSSLQPQNVRLRRAIKDLENAAKHPLYSLMFDPQTAGGLLAAVPMAQAKACVTDLRAGGYPQAAMIGFVSERSDSLESVTFDLDGHLLADVLTMPPAMAVRTPVLPETSDAAQNNTESVH